MCSLLIADRGVPIVASSERAPSVGVCQIPRRASIAKNGWQASRRYCAAPEQAFQTRQAFASRLLRDREKRIARRVIVHLDQIHAAPLEHPNGRSALLGRLDPYPKGPVS